MVERLVPVEKKTVTLEQFQQDLKRLGLNGTQVAQVTNYINQFLKSKTFTFGPDDAVRRVTQAIMDNWPRKKNDTLNYPAITKLPANYLPALVPKVLPKTELPTPVRVSGKLAPVVQSTASVFKYDLRIIPKGLFARSEVYSITSSVPVTCSVVRHLS